MQPEDSTKSNGGGDAPAQRVSRRRTKAQYGLVRFPVDDVRFRNSGEGGMFVKLVVVDDREYDESPWNICCGASVFDHLGEVFVGDDQAPAPVLELGSPDEPPERGLALIQAHDAAHKAWQARHFPNLEDEGSALRETSRPYVASMLLGITGWSGYDDAKGAYWACTRADLTPEGLALLEQLQKLYEGCTLHLLTFLDT